jgi:hypothetical protein
MWQRWRLIGLVTAGLFGIAIVARLVSRLTAEHNEKLQTRIGFVAFVAVAVTIAVVAFSWARRYPMLRVGLDLAGAVVAGCLLSVLIGPFISGGGGPFSKGAGFFFAQIWVYLGVGFGGGLLGLLVVMALGQDYRSQALRQFTLREKGKPRRVTRS